MYTHVQVSKACVIRSNFRLVYNEEAVGRKIPMDTLLVGTYLCAYFMDRSPTSCPLTVTSFIDYTVGLPCSRGPWRVTGFRRSYISLLLLPGTIESDPTKFSFNSFI